MKKKFLALLLVLCMVLGCGSTAFAEEEPSLEAVEAEAKLTGEYLLSSLSPEGLSTGFYSTTRILILAMRSGADCGSVVERYLEKVKTDCMDAEGNWTAGSPEFSYAALLIVLGLAGQDGADFDGVNVIEKLEAALKSIPQENLNDGYANTVNPYHLPYLYLAVRAYAGQFRDARTCMDKVKTALLSYENENGIDYWGNSPDNNGMLLPGFAGLYEEDADVKRLADSALAWTKTQKAGNLFTSWGAANADSTGAALALYSAYGDREEAASAYHGLLSLKIENGQGGYYYTAGDPGWGNGATVDALFGLVTYARALAGKTDPFDVSDTAVGTWQSVIDRIAALPAPSEITLEHKAALEEIQAAYEALPAAFRAKIENYSVYEAVKAAYDVLAASNSGNPDQGLGNTPATGDGSRVAGLLVVMAFAGAVFAVSRKRASGR